MSGWRALLVLAAPLAMGCAAPPPCPDHGPRLDRIEARLDAISGRIDAMDEEREESVSLPGASPKAEIQRIRARIARERPGRRIDGKAVVESCDALLGDELSSPERMEVLILKGMGHRVLRDHAAEEAAFREALDLAGAGTERGRSVRSQLAWTESFKGNHRGAAEAFLELSRDPGHTGYQLAWLHVNAAGQFALAGDGPSARREYELVLGTYGDATDTETRRAADAARRGLGDLEAGRK